jgi:hypothetical protein
MLFGCGLASKDYDVEQPFTAGGTLSSSFTQSFNATQIAGPISADVSKLSTVTLKAARIEATDYAGDLEFVSDATISISAGTLPDALLARLAARAAPGQTSVQLDVTGEELKPYLQAGGTMSATISYSPTPVTAHGLKLVITLHGSLL